MKNVLFGLAVGVVVGYVLRRMEDQGQFECLENELHGLTDKAKKKVKDVVDTGKNQRCGRNNAKKSCKRNSRRRNTAKLKIGRGLFHCDGAKRRLGTAVGGLKGRFAFLDFIFKKVIG